MILDDKRYRHWKIFFEKNIRGVDDEKAIINADRLNVREHQKVLIKGGYYV